MGQPASLNCTIQKDSLWPHDTLGNAEAALVFFLLHPVAGSQLLITRPLCLSFIYRWCGFDHHTAVYALQMPALEY